MTLFQRIHRRSFDIIASLFGLILFWWLILLASIIAYLDTGLNGFFIQNRVGKKGKIIKVFKIRSMRPITGVETTVTTDNDPRISFIGKFWRKSKIDELPQLWNVLKGDMSFVGPRPDVPGFADQLTGKDRLLLSVRPGITGPATLKYKNEEEILAIQPNPEKYNLDVIWPEKVRINREFFENYSFSQEIKIIIATFLPQSKIKNPKLKPISTSHPNYVEISSKKTEEKKLVS